MVWICIIWKNKIKKQKISFVVIVVLLSNASPVRERFGFDFVEQVLKYLLKEHVSQFYKLVLLKCTVTWS